MKIHSKLMLYIGGTAAILTLLVISLATYRLNSILKQIDEQNVKLNFDYMACNAEAVSALESSLMNSALESLSSKLKAIASAPPAQHKALVKSFLLNNSLVDKAAFIERRALQSQEGACELRESCLSTKDGAVVEEDSVSRREAAKLGSISINAPKPKLLPIKPEDTPLDCPMLIAVSLPTPEGAESKLLAFGLSQDFILKALRPSLKDKGASFNEQALIAIASGRGAILLSLKGASLQVPDEIIALLPDSLQNAALQAASKRAGAFKGSGRFFELPHQGSKLPWIVSESPLGAELADASTPMLLKIFPYPKEYSDMGIAKTAQVKLDDLIVMASFIAVFGLLLFFPALFLVAKGIADPLSAAVSFSNVLARGEFPPNSVKSAGADEISELAKSLNHMRDRLNNTISKLKKSHEREMQARKDAEAANHLKSDFLANMSLELRNPLNSIMGFSSLIMKDTERGLYDEALKSKAKTIYDSAESLNSLVSTLLDLSKLDTASVETKPTEFETATLMRELVEANRQAAADRSVTIENHYAPNAPAILFTDRDLLYHTLNLMISSLVKSSPGGKRVSIGCQADGAKVVFRVKDQKAEKSSDSLSDIYLRYSSSHSELLPTLAGATLLNLTIAKNQAHILGADFEAGSDDESNSCFSLVFVRNEVIPASSLETASVHMATNWRSSIAMPTATQTGIQPAFRRSRKGQDSTIKVLMAEDNEANRLLVELMLKDTNCALECVSDGEACLACLAKKKYDILLLDLHMPRLDGYSVLSRIRQDKSYDEMPVVVLTAYLEEGDKEKLVQMGASKCILKPINLDEILNTIRLYAS